MVHPGGKGVNDQEATQDGTGFTFYAEPVVSHFAHLLYVQRGVAHQGRRHAQQNKFLV